MKGDYSAYIILLQPVDGYSQNNFEGWGSADRYLGQGQKGYKISRKAYRC